MLSDFFAIFRSTFSKFNFMSFEKFPIKQLIAIANKILEILFSPLLYYFKR